MASNEKGEFGQNEYNDPSIPPFAKVLTWRDISKRVDAREYWKYKQTVDRENARYHHNAAPLYGEIGDTVNEIRHHRLAVNKNPSNANARNDFGLALLKQGKLDRAEKEINEALAINPDHGLALNNMAAVLARKGKVREALSLSDPRGAKHRSQCEWRGANRQASMSCSLRSQGCSKMAAKGTTRNLSLRSAF